MAPTWWVARDTDHVDYYPAVCADESGRRLRVLTGLRYGQAASVRRLLRQWFWTGQREFWERYDGGSAAGHPWGQIASEVVDFPSTVYEAAIVQ